MNFFRDEHLSRCDFESCKILPELISKRTELMIQSVSVESAKRLHRFIRTVESKLESEGKAEHNCAWFDQRGGPSNLRSLQMEYRAKHP